MNKMSYTTIKHSVIVLAGLVLSAHADHRVYVEAKPGYFFLTDSVQQEIFGNGGFDIGAEIGGDVYSICHSACSSLALRVAAEARFFKQDGRALNSTHCTRLWIRSFTPWAKLVYTRGALNPYIGLAPQFQFVKVCNALFGPALKQKNRGNITFSVTGGCQLVKNHLLFDIFAQYQGGTINFDNPVILYNEPLSIKGFKLGAGIGFMF